MKIPSDGFSLLYITRPGEIKVAKGPAEAV